MSSPTADRQWVMAARTRSDEHGDRHTAKEAVAEAAKRTDTAQPQVTVSGRPRGTTSTRS